MKNSKFKIIIFTLAIIGFFIYGYSKATPGVKNQTRPKPQIEITPESFDFGEVSYGQIIEHSFKVKNIGNEILEIKKVTTSCACTEAKLKTQNSKLKPGEETELIVTYDTGAMSGLHGKGRQKRIVYIKSNDPMNPQVEVKIYANVY